MLYVNFKKYIFAGLFVFALSSIGSVSLDVLSIDIKDGWDALGEISGKTATEEIINNIFSKFCVGK